MATALDGGAMPAFRVGPLIPVIGHMATEFGRAPSLRVAFDCFESSSFQNMCLTSLKCVPYAFFDDNAIVKEFDNGLSCRIRYMEVAVMATASLIYNVVFGVIFTVLSAVTFAQVGMFCNQMRKNWVNATMAGVAGMVSTVGMVSPRWGIKANGVAVLGVGVGLMQWMQGDIAQKVCTVYQNHSAQLINALVEGLNGNEDLYNQQFSPLFIYLNDNLNNQVQTLPDLIRVIGGAGQHLSNAVMPLIRQVFMQNVFPQLIAGMPLSR